MQRRMTEATTRARVLRRVGDRLTGETLALHALGDDLVRVRVQATGVCHSDLHVADGGWAMPLPLVLGHEGAGVVEAVGGGVRHVRPGDHVVLAWLAPCGRCPACAGGHPWLCADTRSLENLLPNGHTSFATLDGGEPVHAYLGLGTFAQRTVVPESAAIPVDGDVPAAVAALIGCAVTTGVGAVLRTARVRPGDSAVVVGCGGVGQSVLLGLALAAAEPVIAVDLSEERLDQARLLGASVVLRGDDPDLVDHVVRLTGGGADHAFEAAGRAATLELLPSLVARGGQAIFVGMPADGTRITVDPFDLADRGKRILGCNYGSSVPAVDFPRLARLYLRGALPLDRLVGRTASLDRADDALRDLREAVGLRTILAPEPE
jgi:S-(hydroxymethyl)glutathione dehydrogenase/alcohol dehydrogenase